MLVRTEIEPYDGGFRITTTVDNGNGWGVGVTFPTERGAQMVATAIELAANDPYYDEGVGCADFEPSPDPDWMNP